MNEKLVDLFDFVVHHRQQLLELILSLLQVGIHLVYFSRYLTEVVRYLF